MSALSNPELMNRFGRLVQTERKITHLVLECIAEIETRRIYLERAYPSLYEFLVKEYGYSPSAAMRRIEAARLLRQVPEIAEKIEAGALNLSQLSQVQQAIRQVHKAEGRKVSPDEKRELLLKIENTSQQTTELILAQELSLPVQTIDKAQVHRDKSVTLTMTFSKEQMAFLQQVQDLIAHCVPEQKWSEVMVYLARKEIDRRTKVKSSFARREDGNLVEVEKTVAVTTSSGRRSLCDRRKPLSPRVRKIILKAQPCCQFQDPVTGKVCGSRKFSQVDHRQSVWAGGTNDPSNLQNLCAQHNQFKYKKEAGLHP